MSDGRSRFRNHVRAAREWLGRAENSLDHKEDIRGDLNVMLAQAELQRAKETKELSRAQRWLHRLLPAAAAVCLVAVCLAFLRWEQSPTGADLAPVRAETVGPTAEPAPAPAAGQAPVVRAVARAEAAAAPAELPSEPVAVPAPVEPASSAAVPSAAPAKAAEQSVYMPSENLQKLMCSAGKSLRAQ